MATIAQELARFISWWRPQGELEDARRLCNLLIAHLDDIAPLTVHQGRRSRYLIGIAQNSLVDTDADLAPDADGAEARQFAWDRLAELRVGPFRGFSMPEVFDLRRRVTLFYGPNGSGKTSVCEALEYALLGAVGEADARRLPQNNYFANARVY